MDEVKEETEENLRERIVINLWVCDLVTSHLALGITPDIKGVPTRSRPLFFRIKHI